MENINPTGKDDAYFNTKLEDVLKGIFTIICNPQIPMSNFN